MNAPPRPLPRVWYHAPLIGALAYLALAFLWIAGGDWLMAYWMPSVATLSWANTGKGMLFALACAGLIHTLLSRLRSLTESHFATLHSGDSTFRCMFDSHPDPLWVFSARTLGILDANRAALHRYGYTREQVLAMSIRDLQEPNRRGSQPDPWAPTHPGGGLLDGRSEHRDAKGQLLHVRVRTREIEYLGQLAHVLEAIPVETLIELERERDRLQDHVRILRDNGIKAHWQLDPASGVVLGGEVAEAHLELPSGSFPRSREDFGGWVRPAWRQAMLLGLERAAQGLEALDIECQVHGLEGFVRVQAAAAEPGQEGRSLVVGSVSDISELKQHEEAMRRRAERFAALVDQLPDPILLIGPQGQVRYANDSAQRLWPSLPGGSLIGSSLEHLLAEDSSPPTEGMPLRRFRLVGGEVRSLLCTELVLEAGEPSITALVIRDDPHTADFAEALRTANARLRRLSQRLVGIQENERRKLARDLHDEVGQALAALSMHIDLMDRKEADQGRRDRIARLRAIVASALQQVRGMLLALRPPQLDELGLGAALSAQLERLADGEGLRIELDCPPLVPRPAAEIESVAFRLAQECLTNVVKHSGASLVKVSVRSRGGDQATLGLELEVMDDGCGFDSSEGRDSGGRLGLLSMRERVALVGGELSIDSVRGLGTRVRARLPLTTPEEVLGDE